MGQSFKQVLGASKYKLSLQVTQLLKFGPLQVRQFSWQRAHVEGLSRKKPSAQDWHYVTSNA